VTSNPHLTGIFTRLQTRARHKNLIGKPAEVINTIGYAVIRIDGIQYLAHRLAWLVSSGSWPVDQIDHINGCRSDNRLSNLREVTNLQNNLNKGIRKNNKTGVVGVSFDSRKKKWRARFKAAGKEIFLGYFDSKELAEIARKNFEMQYSPEYFPL
jgi:hypothetical protein